VIRIPQGVGLKVGSADEIQHREGDNAMVKVVSTYYVEEDDKAKTPEMFGWASEPPDALVAKMLDALELQRVQHTIAHRRVVADRGTRLL
jgi:hypothetical protein